MKKSKFTEEMGYSVQLAERPDPFLDHDVCLMLGADLARRDRHGRLCRTGCFSRRGGHLRRRRDRRDAVQGKVLGDPDAVTATLQRRRDGLVRIGLEAGATSEWIGGILSMKASRSFASRVDMSKLLWAL